MASTPGKTESADDIDPKRVYNAPDGAEISVIVANVRLLFRESSPERVVFERDNGRLEQLESEERPKVILQGDDDQWSAYYQPKGADSGEKIPLEEHQGRSGPTTVELFGTGAPDVTIEWLTDGNGE